MNVVDFSEDLKTMTLEDCLNKHEISLSAAFKIMEKTCKRKKRSNKK